jgi:hypothetical protein
VMNNMTGGSRRKIGKPVCRVEVNHAVAAFSWVKCCEMSNKHEA